MTSLTFRMKSALWARVKAVDSLSVTEVILRSLRAQLTVVQGAKRPDTTPGPSEVVRLNLPESLAVDLKGEAWMIAEAVRLHMVGHVPLPPPREAIQEELEIAQQTAALHLRMKKVVTPSE